MRFLLFIFICAAMKANANYIFDNSQGQVLGETPFFDSDFIRSHKIKKIKGYYSTKASMDIIRETNQVYTYEFDKFGNLIREYLTKDNDTIVKIYIYDSDSRITYIMSSTQFGYTSEHYVYDKKGRVILKETKRETSSADSKLEFEREESYEISKEKYEYIELDNNNYKKLFYNKLGKVYKEEIFFLNDKDKIEGRETRMVIGSARKEIKYLYDDNERISRIESESWIMGHYSSINKFEYDGDGKVMAMHYYKNDHYETEYQIIYDEKTNFLKSILSRNASNDFITILKFSEYSFYHN